MNDNINLMDGQELANRKAEFNLGFIPISPVNDRDTQLDRLQDFMVSDRDPEAAFRAKQYYGPDVPVGKGVVDEEALEYFVGAAAARNMGIAEAPEAYWYGRDKDIPDVEQQDDLFGLMGRELMQDARTRWDEQKALADERVRGLDDLLPELVRAGDTGIDKGENWAKFFDGKSRGVWKDEDHVSVAKAARAWDMMEGYLTSYAAAGAETMTNATTAGLIMDTLRGDEMAEGLFFTTLQTRLGEMLGEAEKENFMVQFGQQFDAAGKKLAAGLLGGHFKAFVTDEQVDAYNAELERAREISGLENPNVELYAEGDNWLERMLPVENARIKAIRVAAEQSGQLNEDGALRKMTDEERYATAELNAFRGKLTNAVNGIYDVDGVAALLGKMMPTSAAFVVPGGAAASFVSMRTQELAEQLGEGESWARANTVATVNAAISAAVEKMAFGSLNPTKWAFGLDKLMSQKVVARALGGIYGTTAGRVGLGVLAGTAEETLAEPTAGLLLAGVYNAMASTELDLEDPLGEYQKEVEAMLKPEQLLATALYGLMLGGVNWQGHKGAAAEYRDVRERLVAMGVEEGRAAAAARIDDPVKRAAAVQELIGQQVKVDAKGVLAYLAEVYPQLGEMATVENYFDKGLLPKVLPGKGGMVRVLEKGEDGKVSEVEMSAETARLMVAARLEELSAKAQVEFADMVLGRAMVGSLKADGSRWAIEEVNEKMDHKYFQRLARAAEIKLAADAREEDVDTSVHGFIPLGHLARQGEAWAQRMQVARHDYEQELGRALTDEEWADKEKELFSRVNRIGLRGQDGRMKTLLRVARGGFTAMDVLEDVTEDNLVRDMIANNRTLDFYIGNMQELETAMGKPGAFLRQLKGENDSHTRMDVVEAMGKLVQSKVLADTARSGNGLSAALNAFLDMLRSWVLKAAALFKLGEALNRVLTDKEALAKVDAEFLGDIDRLVAQDVEWLKGVQLQEGLDAMWRVAKAAARVQAASATPVLDGAEAEHGEAVRAEMRAKEERQRKVDEDVAEGEAVLEEDDFTSSVVAPLLENVDMAKAELKKVQGKVFTNAASKVSAVVSGQTLSKSHAAQMSVRNLTALGYSKEDARKIHYSACAKMHEIFESAPEGKYEPNYDTANKQGRDGAWHYFGRVDISEFGEFDVNVTALKYENPKQKNTLFTLELTVENPSMQGRDTLSQRGLSLNKEGLPERRLAAYRSFVEKEMLDIRKKAEADGTFMKTPNGKDTNLNETQWLQVRTAAFKRWFGDWEKVARFRSAIDKLRSMDDVCAITGDEFAPDGRKLTDKVTEFWSKEYGGVAKNPILGEVILDTRSVKASIAHGVGRLKSAAFAVVHDVIEQGVLVEIAPNWKGRGDDSYVIAAPVQIGGVSYVCEVVVMKGETRTGFYLHEVQIKEKLLDVFKTGVVTGTSGAPQSILLDVWNRVKEIEENCSKVVDERIASKIQSPN